MQSSKPEITIGLPVFNGERFIDGCLRSILEQTFENFELIVSDNASSDATADIIEMYQEKDDRIRLIRRPRNIGAATNFNLIFDEARGDFFKWCACDDLLEPTFLEETLLELKNNPDAVICHSHTKILDLEEGTSSTFEPIIAEDGSDAAARLRNFLNHGGTCYEVFGLMRKSALNRTELIGNYRGGDNVLLGRLALLGSFRVIPKPLFILGRHSRQSTVMVQNSHDFAAWFTGKREKIQFPDWKFVHAMWRITHGLDLSFSQRLRCWKEIGAFTYRSRRRLLRDLRVAAETLVFGTSDPLRRRRIFQNRPQ